MYPHSQICLWLYTHLQTCLQSTLMQETWRKDWINPMKTHSDMIEIFRCHSSLSRSLSFPSYKFSFGFTTGYVQKIRTFVTTSFKFPVSTSTVTKETWLMNFWSLKFQRKTGSPVCRAQFYDVLIKIYNNADWQEDVNFDMTLMTMWP